MATLTTSKTKYNVGSLAATHGATNTTLTGGVGTFVVADYTAGDTVIFTTSAGLADFNSSRKTTVETTVVSVTATALVVAGLDIPVDTYASSEFDLIKTAATTAAEAYPRHSFNSDGEAVRSTITVNGGTNINYDISVKGIIDGIVLPTGSTITPEEYGTTYLVGTAT